MQENFIDSFYKAMSVRRLATFTDGGLDNELKIVCGHLWNISLSKSLYPSLRILEITLMNALHTAISEYYDNESWFDNPTILSERFSIQSIAKAKSELVKRNKTIDADRVVAELHFGFWTSLFDVRYEHEKIFWPKLLKQVFLNIPKSLRRRDHISRRLNKIRNLRNRIFHYEPIWYWQDLREQHQIIIDMINWLQPAMCDYVKLQDDFEVIYNDGWFQYQDLVKRLLNLSL